MIVSSANCKLLMRWPPIFTPISHPPRLCLMIRSLYRLNKTRESICSLLNTLIEHHCRFGGQISGFSKIILDLQVFKDFRHEFLNFSKTINISDRLLLLMIRHTGIKHTLDIKKFNL